MAGVMVAGRKVTEGRRRELFKAALAYLGLRRAEWSDAHGVPLGTLDAALFRVRPTPRVDALVDATIRQFLTKAIHEFGDLLDCRGAA